MHTRRMVFSVVALCAMFVSVEKIPAAAASEEVRTPADPSQPPRLLTAQDLVEDGNLVVIGNACIGEACTNTDDDFSAIRLKAPQPNILFDDDFVEGGGTPHDWAVLINPGSSAEFSIADFENELIPFTIAAGAPTDSVYVGDDGNLGLGTSTPSHPLHVSRSNGTAKVLIEETSGTATARELLELKNRGGAALILDDTNDVTRWSTIAIGSQYLINNQANAGVEVTVSSTGNLIIAGLLTQGSDRDTKRDISPVQPEEILAKVASLPITTWNRKTDSPSVRHMGPMAQDFAAVFGLGDDDRHIAVLDIAGVSLASIQALHGMMAKSIAEKDTEIAALRQRLAALEELVSKLAAPQSP